MTSLTLTTMDTPWLREKLAVKTSGELVISVRYASGQVSSFEIDSKATVKELKSKMNAAAMLDGIGGQMSVRGLSFLGKTLGDDAVLESCGIVDRSCLDEIYIAPQSPKSVARENQSTLDAVAASVANYGSHTAALEERVKHIEPPRPDHDYTTPSWHDTYKPYGQYVPPKDGVASVQAPDYEDGSKEAWRKRGF